MSGGLVSSNMSRACLERANNVAGWDVFGPEILGRRLVWLKPEVETLGDRQD